MKHGFAFATSHHQVIECFSRWGLRVEAVTARAELCETIEVMHDIANQVEGVADSDFINLWPSPKRRYEAHEVFMVQGHYVNSQAALGGFAVAPTADLMATKLFGMGFEVRTHSSLHEMEQALLEMDRLQVGDADLVDLVELTEA